MNFVANPVILPIPLVDFPVITKDDAVAAFRNYVASKMCWEHSFTQNLLVLAVDLRIFFHPQDEMSYCYKITLDNYYESRSAMWQESRLSTAPLSPLGAGPCPHPWELPFSAPTPFTDRKESLSVPYTDVVRPCSFCMGGSSARLSRLGKGRSPCSACRGSGSAPCSQCRGDGAPCSACGGTGRVYCTECQGLGDVNCERCEGRGKMKLEVVVTSECRTSTFSSTIERGGLTKEYLSLLEGKQVYCVQGQRLEEGDSFYDNAVNQAVREVLEKAQKVGDGRCNDG